VKNILSKRFFPVRWIYTSMALLDEPFYALFLLLPFILKKNLGATAFELAFLTSLRPVVASFSFYWTANLKRRPDKLITNLMGAFFLARLPFIFFPFIDNVWYIIFSVGVYQLFSRASMPALMEILKQHYSKEKREKLVGRVYLLKFVESAILALFSLGGILDSFPDLWKVLFPVFVLLSFSTLLLQKNIAILQKSEVMPTPKGVNRLLQPWKDSFSLLKKRRDFARFQWGFMIGGFGLMLIAPARICYFDDVLSLTTSQYCSGQYLWMGIGVFLATSLWRWGLSRYSLDRMMTLMLVGFSLFPIALLLGQIDLLFFYLAFFFYGVAQAGSHLLWNLSGGYFARQEQSAMYSTVNLHMIGIRGLIGPLCGAWLSEYLSPQFAMASGAVICLLGACYLYVTKRASSRAVYEVSS
jgi:hypothetical protein